MQQGGLGLSADGAGEEKEGRVGVTRKVWKGSRMCRAEQRVLHEAAMTRGRDAWLAGRGCPSASLPPSLPPLLPPR